MREDTRRKVESIAAAISSAVTQAIGNAAETFMFEDKPLVVVNIFVIEHGGNWNIGDKAIQADRESFRG